MQTALWSSAARAVTKGHHNLCVGDAATVD
jgi:hypothetical protein